MARSNWVYKVVDHLGNSIRVEEFNVCKVTCHIFKIPCEFIFYCNAKPWCVRVLVRKEEGRNFELALKQTNIDELTNGPKCHYDTITTWIYCWPTMGSW
jgi:hypothetical protein